MFKNGKRSLPFFWMLLGLMPFMAQAASLNLDIQDERVYLEADKVSVISVLNAIAEKTNITITSDEPLTRAVSLTLDNVSLEESISRLLTDQSYVLVFDKSIGPNGPNITEVRILSYVAEGMSIVSGLPTAVAVAVPERLEIPVHQPAEPASPEIYENPMRTFEKSLFREAFENEVSIAVEITTEEVEGEALLEGQSVQDGVASSSNSIMPRQQGGMRIKGIADASVFTQMGLKPGDVVRNVNGQPITKSEDFIAAIQQASQDQPMIMIERTNENNMMSKLYIDLTASNPSEPPPPEGQ
jgi:hypothetical protein